MGSGHIVSRVYPFRVEGILGRVDWAIYANGFYADHPESQ